MVASLPMYDLPELRAVTDDWWRGLARALRRAGVAEVPGRLERSASPSSVWASPALVLSQCCGFGLVGELAGVVRPVATPVYDAPGCGGAGAHGSTYRSAIVVREDAPARALDDLRGAVAAYNEVDSHSGYNALRAVVAPLSEGGRFFARAEASGSHEASLECVARGRADVAAVDAVVWALLGRVRPGATRGLRVLAWTEPAPALPYVTAAGRSDDQVARIREALGAAAQAPDLEAARSALLIEGLVVLERGDYAPITEQARAARARGYPALR